MFSVPALLCALSAAVVSVSAHGYVQQVLIDGAYYTGYLPYEDPYTVPPPTRIIRTIPGNQPVLDATSPDIICNQGGETGAHTAVANIKAGSEITFFMTSWPDSHKGPVSTYMASCNGLCSSFSTNSSQWFKVAAAGYESGVWAATKLIAANNTWSTIVPAGIAPGQYLIRFEIVALHNTGAPQFYPSCTQLNVTSEGSDKPTSSELVEMTQLYKDFVPPNIYTDFGSFEIPGPKVVSFSTGQDTGSGLTLGSDSGSGSDSNSNSNPPTPSSPSSSSSHSSTPPFSPSPTSTPGPAVASPSSTCNPSGSRRGGRHGQGHPHRRLSA